MAGGTRDGVRGEHCILCLWKEQKGRPGLGRRREKMIWDLIEEELVSVSTALWK